MVAFACFASANEVLEDCRLCRNGFTEKECHCTGIKIMGSVLKLKGVLADGYCCQD